MSKLKCPNCNKNLIYVGKVTFNKYNNYDKWVCEDCSHIIVLDWRSEV